MDNIDISTLSKKERREFFREQKQLEEEKERNKSRIIKLLVIVVMAATVLGGIFLLIKELSKPLPGLAVPDLGREHVPDGTEVKYNSNPPTSGSHYADWTKAGIYDQPISDGHLVHSLEHGYVVISYNCEKKFSIFHFPFSNVFAHEEDLSSTDGSSPSGKLSGGAWRSKECEDLKKQLIDIANKNRLWKIIVIPRPTLDAKIALTAWTRLEKMNDIEGEKIKTFIDAFRDHGPEKTTE